MKYPNILLRSLIDSMSAIRDHLWTAFDVARNAHWRKAPQLVDLLAGRKRRGFCESPDSLYTIGFINIQNNTEYTLTIAQSSTLYIAVSLSGGGKQTVWEVHRKMDQVDIPQLQVTIKHGTSDTNSIDTCLYSGMTQIMVRQYFDNAQDSLTHPHPKLEVREKLKGNKKSIYFMPAGLLAGAYFLAWRLKSVLGIKYVQYRLGSRFPRNQFLSLDEVRDLWKGGQETVNRLGIKSFRYLFCIFELKPGEILKIQYRPQESKYFALGLNNAWLQGIDKTYQASYRNSLHMCKDNEGNFSIYVGDQNPGYENYLDTHGYSAGLIHFREIFPGQNTIKPKTELVAYHQ